MDWYRRPACRFALDGVLAIGVATFATIAALLAAPSTRDLDATGHALLFVGSFALVARRRLPVTVLIVTAVCALWYQARGYPGLMTTLPVPFAVYTAVSSGRGRAAIVALVGVVVAVATAARVLPHMQPMRELAEAKFMLLGWLLAGGVTAEMSRHRRAYVEQVEQRALDAERTREETARRRASDERLRIARDLHDTLTHSISVIKVQAGVGIHLARKNGDPVPETLLAIEEASTEAVRELRATLDVLRQPGSCGDDDPGCGLDRLDDLVERTRAAGVPVIVDVCGERHELPPAVDEAAYRIIQESLTNVARHAGGDAAATIQVTYSAHELAVQVDDDGWASPDHVPIPGVGLIGMRERVTALGGRLHARPRDGGGFGVTATLPLDATAGEDVRAGSAVREPTIVAEASVEVVDS